MVSRVSSLKQLIFHRALSWVHCHSQSLVIGGNSVPKFPLRQALDALQGSVLGLLLFNIVSNDYFYTIKENYCFYIAHLL